METGHTDFASSWRSIDGHDADPYCFVKFMDKMNGLGFFQQLKRRSMDLLEADQGNRVLDVGCGAGDETRALARAVGAEGRVTGIDASEVMLAEARKRSSLAAKEVEYIHGDAHSLQFPDGAFDRCCSFGLLEVADDPKQVLAEMVRVTRPGGRIATPVFDLDSMMIDSSLKDVTRRITHNYCDTCNGWLGRQLPAICRELGVVDLVITPMTLIVTDYSVLQELWLPPMIEDARRAGIASPVEIHDWLADLEARDRRGCFFWTATAVIAAGRKQ